MNDIKLSQQYSFNNNAAVLLCNRSVAKPGVETINFLFIEAQIQENLKGDLVSTRD
jgi:hypothetical protein